MKRRPEFTIIAGPNGASKSRLGIFYSTVKAFDGDLLAMSFRNEHPEKSKIKKIDINRHLI